MSPGSAEASWNIGSVDRGKRRRISRFGFWVALPDPAAKRTHASEGKVIKHLSRSSLGVGRFMLMV